MTFATVCENRQLLSQLSRLLLSAFPGSTVHQNRDPERAVQRLSSHEVDAIFADADTCSDWVHLMRRHHANTSVYLLCRQDLLPPEGTGDIRGIVTYPITKQKIQIALQNIPREIREVV